MISARYIVGLFLTTVFLFCDSPIDTNNNNGDDPGAIISPVSNSSLLIGDTITIAWTSPVSKPVIEYNYYDTNQNFSDTLWHPFSDSEIVSINGNSARVKIKLDLYGRSDNFKVRVISASGKKSESGRLSIDHIVLLQPTGGETFTIGQSVPIKFKRNKFINRVYLYFITGQTGSIPLDLVSPDINFTVRGTGTMTTTFDTTWVIGSEAIIPGTAPRYPNDSCYIYAFSYYLGTKYQGSPLGENSDHNFIPFRIIK